jgi:phosphoadenosine phosphosulfate reductase
MTATHMTATHGDARLWQRPRVDAPPAGYAEREAALHALVTEIGRRYARAVLASSLSVEDAVLAHAIAATAAPIAVFVIDTGRLHRSTLALIAASEHRFGRPVIVVRPEQRAVDAHVAQHGAFGFYDSVAVRHACCHLRKVEPLQRVLAGRDAWLTGQRRSHGPERAGLAIEERDAARGIAKFNPLATWDDAAVWHYADRHQVPINPLYLRGYPSIGCEPCTRAVRNGEDPRAGRWWWEAAHTKECGLHVAGAASAIASEGTR